MKPKQLANVLTRILGLSLCAHGVPALLSIVVTGIALLIQKMHDGNGNIPEHYPYLTYSMFYYISPVIEFAIGIYLICRSRLIIEKLFKDEAE